jgi:hypothetical protein
VWYGEHRFCSRIQRVARWLRAIGRESRIVGERSYPGDDGAGARSNGRGDNADGGENIGLARKLLPVTWNPV